MAIGLIFSGQGAQQVGMAKSLYENSDIARSLFEEANDVLGFDLAKLCFEGPEEMLTQTKICQPALFVHGYAIYRILEDSGRLKDFQISLGLSLGELTALTVAGALDFSSGLKTVAKRGQLMQDACEQTEGGMASVIGGTREKVEALCEECGVEMANLNCPGQIVISGEKAKINQAVDKGKDFGFKLIKPLKVAGAYHSRLMESAKVAFANFLEDIEFKKPRITVLTNTTAQAVEAPNEIREALAKQVVSPVLWEDCMRNAVTAGVNTFYECGPGKVLAGLARRIDRSLVVESISEYDDLGSSVSS